MSHDEDHITSTREKLVRMANQIAAFFHSRPREEGVVGVAEHINKFWEPRMRRQLRITASRPASGPQPGWMQATGTPTAHSPSIAATSRSLKAR